MSDEIEDAFSDLSPTYPGSSQKRRSLVEQVSVTPTDDEAWYARPRILEVDGAEVEFFLIGALSKAINRSPITLRKWMRLGVMPPARFIAPGVTRKGERRLWTRAQIEGLIKIAREERIDQKKTPIGSTQFTSRAFELFRALRESK